MTIALLARQPRSMPAPFTAFADIAAQRRTSGVRMFASCPVPD